MLEVTTHRFLDKQVVCKDVDDDKHLTKNKPMNVTLFSTIHIQLSPYIDMMFIMHNLLYCVFLIIYVLSNH